jgi:hypothetical protein
MVQLLVIALKHLQMRQCHIPLLPSLQLIHQGAAAEDIGKNGGK